MAIIKSKTAAIGKYRWRIVALLFFATAIKYIDRNVLSFTMIDEGFRRQMLGLGADEVLTGAQLDRFRILIGYVDAAFKLAYASGFVLMGCMMDKIRVRKGYSLAIIIWSLAGMFTAFVNGIKGLGFIRFIFGFGESANFPVAIKTIAEWFPKKERAHATGVYNAGASVGIITTAFLVPWIIIHQGWRGSFLLTGLLGLVLLGCWWSIYKSPNAHPKVTSGELAFIRSDVENPVQGQHMSWKALLSHRGAWAIALGKFFTDPVWWFYLTWLPDFFNSNEALDEKLSLLGLGLPFMVIYLTSDVGSIFFGWVSGKFMSMGWSVNKSRKLTMLMCAQFVLPLVFAANVSNVYLAMALIALAAAGHQGWSANIFTLSSDIFPKESLGAVVGLGGMVGAVGGTIFAALAGITRVYWGYQFIFIIAASAYLFALLVIHLLVPHISKSGQ